MRVGPSLAAFAIVLALLAPAAAIDDTEKELEKYRQMLKADPWSSPGLLDADRGEALWKEKRGPKKASLEGCDQSGADRGSGGIRDVAGKPR